MNQMMSRKEIIEMICWILSRVQKEKVQETDSDRQKQT